MIPSPSSATTFSLRAVEPRPTDRVGTPRTRRRLRRSFRRPALNVRSSLYWLSRRRRQTESPPERTLCRRETVSRGQRPAERNGAGTVAHPQQRSSVRQLTRKKPREIAAPRPTHRNNGSCRTAWWRMQSDAYPSLRGNSRLSGKITGNFANPDVFTPFAGIKRAHISRSLGRNSLSN